MKLNNTRVIITGASGGIGRHIAVQLAKKGAHVALVGRRHDALMAVHDEIKSVADVDVCVVPADLATSQGRQGMITHVRRSLGGIDILINNAGVVDFHDFSEQDPAMIERIYQTNLIAPVQLAREVLPTMLEQERGRIVNVGSTFGSIAFAYFAAYSSSKFALRGFSEALRRELAGTGVGVTYAAPRAVRTAANSHAVFQMAEATGMHMDEPELVARFIVEALIKDKKNAYYGWPEKFFVRVNSLFPGLVDAALRKQNRIMARFAPKA